MTTILKLLEIKGHSPVHTIGPNDTLFDAVTKMVDQNIGAVLVVEDEVIKGIITERDYLRFIAKEGHSARETPVHSLMTRKVIYVTPEATVQSVMAMMTEARIRHSPVMNEGRLMGLVSMGDLVKQITEEQEIHINTLEEFISDPYPGPAGSSIRKAKS
jgi:CBS domain-containing protein